MLIEDELPSRYVNAHVCHSQFSVVIRRRDMPDMCYSIAHELGHVLDLTRERKVVSEVKADVFACFLLELFGIDKSEESANYIAGWLDHGRISDPALIDRIHSSMKRLAWQEADKILRGLVE